MCFIFGISAIAITLEVNAQPETTFEVYQSPKLGVTFQYPSEWKEDLSEPSDDCKKTNNCSVSFWIFNVFPNKTIDNYNVNIMAIKLDMPSLETEACNCNTSKDFLSWMYNSLWKDNTFINDNQTVIQNNRSAWQIEFGSGDPDRDGRYFAVMTVNGNYGYKFMYSGASNSTFGKYLEGFRKILDTVNFTTVETEKQPSFLSNTDNSKIDLGNETEERHAPNVGGVNLLSSESYLDSIGFLHIVGEIQNNALQIATSVKVVGTLYDNSNDVVGTTFTHTNPPDINPGDKAPFEILVTSASIPLAEIDHHRLVVTHQ